MHHDLGSLPPVYQGANLPKERCNRLETKVPVRPAHDRQWMGPGTLEDAEPNVGGVNDLHHAPQRDVLDMISFHRDEMRERWVKPLYRAGSGGGSRDDSMISTSSSAGRLSIGVRRFRFLEWTEMWSQIVVWIECRAR